VDFPTSLGLYEKPNADGSYPCQVKSTAILNGLPPVITRVCQESRNVAHESGGIVPDDFYDDSPADAVWVSPTSDGVADMFWVDPKRDSAHLNWLPHYEAIYENCSGSALACLAWSSRQVVGSPSIMGGWFSAGCDHEEERFDVLYQVPSCWVIMHVSIIHANFREAAQSGLFGLLGDAPVQVVPLSNREKINALYRFADQLSSPGRLERLSPESLNLQFKDNIIKKMGSDRLLSKMHPAIMFRVCVSKCNSYNKERLSSG
jgi:hypothetical protein